MACVNWDVQALAVASSMHQAPYFWQTQYKAAESRQSGQLKGKQNPVARAGWQYRTMWQLGCRQTHASKACTDLVKHPRVIQ